MINYIKKKLQFVFKQIAYKSLFILHGKIKGVISSANNALIEIKKVELDKNLFYKIYSIKSGRLYTDRINDTAFILEDKIIEGPSFQFRNVKNANCEENIVFEKGTPRFKRKIKGNLFSLLTGGAGNSNYWHWLFDVLPRLKILNSHLNPTNINYFLFPSLSENFQTETLDILKIDKKKRLSSKKFRHIVADNILTVDHPYVLNNNPSIEIQNIPTWIIMWLKKSFLNNTNEISDQPKKIYIDRSDSKSNHRHLRKITNEPEVRSILEKNNFKTVALSKLSLKRQIALFNNADQIVGLHGAGFANIIFCKPKTKVLELKPNTAGDVIKNLASSGVPFSMVLLNVFISVSDKFSVAHPTI